ncbi:MAG: MaoC family dehydratase N-terminal domain-containing protein [Halioglobus sp.]
MTSELRAWIGREATVVDTVTLSRAEQLAATLGYSQGRLEQGSELPPGWHWLYFLEAAPAQTIAVDGHPEKGGFLPPVALPRRMWAGSRLRFLAPLRVGDTAQRKTTISDIRQRQGRSGELVFVTLRHEILRGRELLLEEEQDIVYRGPARTATPDSEKPFENGPWSRTVEVDPVLLFRYSALTFNAHRIHYDRNYAVGVEEYAGLVVQGPLSATLLLDLLHREMPAATLRAFRFRGLRPLTDDAPLELGGRARGSTVELWAGSAGSVAMEAEAEIA